MCSVRPQAVPVLSLFLGGPDPPLCSQAVRQAPHLQRGAVLQPAQARAGPRRREPHTDLCLGSQRPPPAADCRYVPVGCVF